MSVGYVTNGLMPANPGKVIDPQAIALAERAQDAQEAQQMKTKITAKIKALKQAQKEQEQQGQPNNGTQIFSDMADSGFQVAQMEIATDGLAVTSSQATISMVPSSKPSPPQPGINRIA